MKELDALVLINDGDFQHAYLLHCAHKHTLISFIFSLKVAGESLTPPTTPRPPALVTAATKSEPDVGPIPASTTGCWILSNFVNSVVNIFIDFLAIPFSKG